MINARSAANTNHFRIGPGDYVAPCPFCGNQTINADKHVEDGGIELKNTHTASYWVECGNCTAEISGSNFDGHNERTHKAAALSALAAWNDRVTP